MSFFNKKAVLSYLPHREPFLFVDSIEKIDLPDGVTACELELTDFKPLVGGRVIGTFFVSEKLDCFRGHFPDNPIFPGVLQVEMMAQVSSFLMSACRNFDVENTEMDVAFLRVDGVRFRKKVIPNMTLTTEAKLIKVRGGVCQFECFVTDGDDIVSQGEVLASLKFKG